MNPKVYSVAPTRDRRETGFSLIEALVAAAILLLVAVGLLPLFANAMVLNKSGNESTVVTNHGKTMVEDLGQLPFNNGRLAVAAGTETTSTEQWAEGLIDHYGDTDEGWVTGEPSTNGQLTWNRQLTVRQYHLEEDIGADGPGGYRSLVIEPVTGTLSPEINFKEIEVQIQPRRTAGGPLGRGQQLTLRTYKFVG